LAGVAVSATIALGILTFTRSEWSDVPPSWLIGWAVFCAASNLLPAPAGPHLSHSMSGPVNIGIAFLFTPPVAATIVALAATSEWELKGETTFLHAVYNRAQLALATAASSAVFALDRHEVPSAWLAIAAVVTYTVGNWLLVAAAEHAARGTPLRLIFRRLVPPGVIPAATYLAVGMVGVVLALASLRIGVWTVAFLIVPLVSTRYAINASRELERGERARRALSDRLVDEREREQARIASDIHDVVLQDLAGLRLQTQNIRAALEHDQMDVAIAMSEAAAESVSQTIRDLRQAISSLRRTTLDDDGLVATLQRFCRSFHAESGIQATVHAERLDVDRLPHAASVLAYECCQEALANVRSHSGASSVSIEVSQEGGMLDVRVSDNGTGPAAEPGLGLTLMKDKVALAGGGLWTTRRPSGGMALVLRIPIEAT
jgi:signal transduction histidine kinase